MSFQFKFGRPQKAVAVILVLFFGFALALIGHAPLKERDYRYALCGREMWEKPSPALGYFTTCGNLQGDGTLAYRAAGLPLSAYLAGLRANDWAHQRWEQHKPEKDRTYISNPVAGSTYDLRHQIHGTAYLLRVPFALAATLLGASLWWVARRLFGNIPGALALGLYCTSPMVLRYATTENNEIFAAWGIFAAVFTAIGIAHAMYGPPRKWKPRIVIFTLALGLTATAHVLAAIVALVFAAAFMFWIAERRRGEVLPLLIGCSLASTLVLLASFAFHISSFVYILEGGAALFTLSTLPVRTFLFAPVQLASTALIAVAVLLYASQRRSRYFGNTAPLLVSLALLPIATTQVAASPVMWAWPFLLTFACGVFADSIETRHRKLYLAMGATALAAQCVQCALAVPSLLS